MSLFTSNFKNYSITFLTVFSVGIFLFIVGSEFIVRNYVIPYNNYEKLRSNLWNKSFKYAVFADSRGENGIFGNKELGNFSMKGNNLLSILQMSDFYLEKNQLKGLIIQLDPHQFSSYRLFDDQSQLMIDLLTQNRKILAFLRPSYKQHLIGYWKNLPNKIFENNKVKEKNKIDDKVKENNNFDENLNTKMKETSIRVQMHKPIESFSDLKATLTLKEFVKKHRIVTKICLVSFPVDEIYNSNAKKYNSFSEIIDFFKSLGATNNVRYIDYSASMENKYFSDSDHLNTNGARIFSKNVVNDCFIN